ncbi:MAG: ABC transporter permease [Rhodospirillaceae bacterium]
MRRDSPTAPGAARATLRLAVSDFRHEWRVSACLVLALAAVLAPLLVLFGLKSGIVSTMRDRLITDPRNLEVVIAGSYALGPEWFAALEQRNDVGFLVPRTRSLAATVDLLEPGGKSLAAVEMVPTGAGDPLLRQVLPPAGPGEVLLSHSAARSLGVADGAIVTALIARTVQGERQVARQPLTVRGVLPEAVFGRDGAFVTLDLLVGAEDYRDGKAASLNGAPPTPDRAYSSARLFARDLDAVGPLADVLRGGGMEVRTRADDIETVKAIDRTLSFIFTVVAGIAVTGYLLSLAASLWANVDRKRRELALMRLVGFPTASVVAFPAIQALLIALIGVALSAAVAWGVAEAFNVTLSANLAQQEFVCRLLPGDLAVSAAVTIVLALIASSIGGYRAARFDPAESLRDI